MKSILAAGLLAYLTACASYDGYSLRPGIASAVDVERVMGMPADRKEVRGETWLYYPRQPYGYQCFVARIGADGRLIAVEPRLTDQNVAHITPNLTRADRVRELLGPPWVAGYDARLEREIWIWKMRRHGDTGIPAELNVRMSVDGVVREVFLREEPTGRPGLFFGGLRY